MQHEDGNEGSLSVLSANERSISFIKKSHYRTNRLKKKSRSDK